ncbi:MAG: carboxylating nicotinate-nucleotide diphosphorylase [Candidatus Omnitrophica bacterium]|nr:carboxylating nicotinate-nucleotide diphosphorylase [Candidatus Omnitrophota bacterium]
MGKVFSRTSGINIELIDKIIKQALSEDKVSKDITTKLLFPEDKIVKAVIIAKERGIIAGLDVVKRAFFLLDKNTKFKKLTHDGRVVKKGEKVALIVGSIKKILYGERTALNFLMRLSGIATMTRKFVEIVHPYKVKILDTRKTTPGIRILEKYAVRVGGGSNHRMDLSDGVLIKDNHLKNIRYQESNIKNLIKRIRKKIPKDVDIEIEVGNIKEFKMVLQAKPDIIMLDNMSIKEIKKAVSIRNRISKTTQLEVSGGINLKNVRTFASTGIERISIGQLTHSSPSIDFSLELF